MPPLLITNLPADVCRQCGERTYATTTLAALERIRDGDGPDPQLGYMHVLDFDEVGRSAAVSVSDYRVPQSLVVHASTTVGISPIREAVG